MPMPIDYSQGALMQGGQGALTSPQSMPAQLGGFDPATIGLLGLASGLLQAGGPSRMPISFGQALGAGLQQGAGAFQGAQQFQQQTAMNQARAGLLNYQIAKAKADLDLQNQLTGGAGGGILSQMNNPDKLEMLGTRLAAAGHAGGAEMISRAAQLRQQQQNASAVDAMRSAPGVLGAGVTTSSPQGQALLSQSTGSGDPTFDAAVLQSTNQALNSNAGLAPQPIQPPRPGVYAPLFNSPYVGPYARSQQTQLDASRGAGQGGYTPQSVTQQFDRLLQMDQTATNAATAREENAGLRRDLASMAAGNRQNNQQNLQDQRVFTRERELSQDYNNLSKPYRAALPAFNSSAQYVAGGKFDSSGDRALTFAYAKMLDPNDRVGVNDIKDINKLGNVPERVVQAVRMLDEGKALPDRIRSEMFTVMRGRFDAMNEQQKQIEDEYEQRATRYMANPSNVVMRHSQRGVSRGATSGWSIEKVSP